MLDGVFVDVANSRAMKTGDYLCQDNMERGFGGRVGMSGACLSRLMSGDRQPSAGPARAIGVAGGVVTLRGFCGEPEPDGAAVA